MYMALFSEPNHVDRGSIYPGKKPKCYYYAKWIIVINCFYAFILIFKFNISLKLTKHASFFDLWLKHADP